MGVWDHVCVLQEQYTKLGSHAAHAANIIAPAACGVRWICICANVWTTHTHPMHIHTHQQQQSYSIHFIWARTWRMVDPHKTAGIKPPPPCRATIYTVYTRDRREAQHRPIKYAHSTVNRQKWKWNMVVCTEQNFNFVPKNYSISCSQSVFSSLYSQKQSTSFQTNYNLFRSMTHVLQKFNSYEQCTKYGSMIGLPQIANRSSEMEC